MLFILILCGLGVPLPEDVPLITGGYLISRHGSLPLMIAVGLLGILIGDSIIFRAGQTYGEKLLETRLGKHIPGERVQRTVELFERHGPKFILVARFVPVMRAVTYFVAGTTGVPYWKFLAYDGLAACVSAPAWVLLGHWAGRHRMLHRAWQYAANAQLWVLAGIAVLAALWVATALIRKRMRDRRAARQALLAGRGLQAIQGGRREPTPLERPARSHSSS